MNIENVTACVRMIRENIYRNTREGLEMTSEEREALLSPFFKDMDDEEVSLVLYMVMKEHQLNTALAGFLEDSVRIGLISTEKADLLNRTVCELLELMTASN